MYAYLLAPIVGGVIGYITNDIAIRMLFRPRKAKYLFGWHIPFTPGLIPKEKGRIATAIAEAISDNLMSQDVLERYLLADEMVEKVRTAAQQYLEKLETVDITLQIYLEQFFSDEEIQTIATTISQNLSMQMSKALTQSDVGNRVAHYAMEHVANKLSASGENELLGALSSLGGLAASLLGGGIIGKFLGMLRQPAEELLAKQINEMISANGEEMVGHIIEQEAGNLLQMRVCDLIARHKAQIAGLPDTAASLYAKAIRLHLPQLLRSVNLARLVENRINEMDVIETEQLILQVMNKELRAIVWLGAGLGAIMGCINLLF